MDHSSVTLGLQHHARSISLPTRTQPDYCRIEVELNKQKTWEASVFSAAASAPVCSETIQTGLVGLAELFNCVHDLLGSPTAQSTLLKDQQGTTMEAALEASVGILDSCGAIKELLLKMKEQLKDLQSALRRKGADASIDDHITAYISLRKQVKKDVSKNLRVLKQVANKNVESSPSNTDEERLSRVLREVSASTVSVFRSILLFLSVTNTKPSGWSVISKLIRGADQKLMNEVGSVDVSLHSLHQQIKSNSSKLDVQIMLGRLQALDVNIQDLESGMDCLFRQLIQTRVSLLNIITF